MLNSGRPSSFLRYLSYYVAHVVGEGGLMNTEIPIGLTFDDVLKQNLRVMDHSAISLCRENHIPVVVLNIFHEGNMARAICGEAVGTLVTGE